MIGGKTAATVAFAAMLATTAVFNLPGRGDAAREKVICTDFATFDEAQKALLDNEKNAVTLDPDGNGIACEQVFPAESAAAATATAAASTPTAEAQTGNAEKKAARQATATAEAAASETPTPEAANETQTANADKKAARQATATAEAEQSANGNAGNAGNAQKKAARQATATAGAAAAKGNGKKNAKETPTPEATAPTPAGGDLDCIDFAFQEDAQAVLDKNPKDPYNLDPNHDGIACSSLPRRGGPIVALPATGSGPLPMDGWPVHAGL